MLADALAVAVLCGLAITDQRVTGVQAYHMAAWAGGAGGEEKSLVAVAEPALRRHDDVVLACPLDGLVEFCLLLDCHGRCSLLSVSSLIHYQEYTSSFKHCQAYK